MGVGVIQEARAHEMGGEGTHTSSVAGSTMVMDGGRGGTELPHPHSTNNH